MTLQTWLRLLANTPILWGIIQLIALYTYIQYKPSAHNSINRLFFEVSAHIQQFFHRIRGPWLALRRVQELEIAYKQAVEALSSVSQATGPIAYPLGAWGDFTATKEYLLIPAEPIYQTFHLRENYAILNKGGRDGVYPGLGVISTHGVVGIVAETTATHSIVYAVFHKDIHLAAKLPRHQVIGLTSWPEPILNRLLLEYVPLYVQVEIGDEVWTGPSTLFPSGLRIGRVQKVKTDFTRGFHAIEVATYADWHRIGALFVLRPKSP